MHSRKDCTNSENQVLKTQMDRNIRTYRVTIIRGKKMKQVQPTRLILGHLNHGNADISLESMNGHRPKDSNSVGTQQFHDPMSIHNFNSNMGGQGGLQVSPSSISKQSSARVVPQSQLISADEGYHIHQNISDEIVPKIETSDNVHHSESDEDYDPEKEMDIIDDNHDSEGWPGDKEVNGDQIVRYEHIAEDAPPINNDINEDALPTDALTTTISVGSKKRKGRGPTKNLKVTEPMHLEYNALGQPCGKWRRQYGKQVGLCIRKISILHSWNDVSEGLKNSLWVDTMNLFHIENDEEKKKVFLSAVAERFRDFKSKLVTGWITKKRARKTMVKMGTEGRNEGRDQSPTKMPYEIWGNISKNEWEAFVAKKTTPVEVEKRGKASKSASKRKFYHRLGPKTYDEARKEWVDAGLYPNQSPIPPSSTATSASVNTSAGDRGRDWYCGLHSRDASGKFTITDPETKKVADAVLGWKEKEATGEFTPRGNVDALHMVLGKDHTGRVVGKGGVRVGLKKAFGKECVATQSKTMPPDEVATLTAKITKDVLDKVTFMLQKMGAPNVDLANMIAEDQQSQHGNPKASVERTPEPITPIETQPITTPETTNPTPETMNTTVAQNPEPTPEPVVK
ncbi:unnamed protein product [Amaranthus hypochondriacus]